MRFWRWPAAHPRLGVLFSMVVLAAAPVFAVQRKFEIAAPASAAPGARIEVSIHVSTDAGAGEQIGFLQVDFSIDSGSTWTGLCYEQNIDTATTRQFSITTGVAGSRTLVRARVAFRGGAAGDVDYNGAAIKWQDSWQKWQQPPARWVETDVTAR